MTRKNKFFLLLPLVLLLFGTVNAHAAGTAPVAEDLELASDGRAVISGLLSAYDAEGGALRFFLTTEPRHGSILLHENGEFLYSPAPRARRDYFGYRAVDSEGNESEEATVIIRISRPPRRDNSVLSQPCGQ